MADDDDLNALLTRKDSRGKKDRKRLQKEIKQKEQYTKENFKKMKEEIDELRKKVDEQEKKRIVTRDVEYALGFDKSTYLNMGFIESAQWIRTFLAKKMIEKMMEQEFEEKFRCLMRTRDGSRRIGLRTCARFNRNEECTMGRWHTTYADANLRGERRPEELGERDQRRPPPRSEMRVHACTLCLEALGSINGHNILNCPWILEKNWKE